MIRSAAVLTLCLVAASASALELSLPGNARPTAEVVTDPDSYALPTGPFAVGRVPVQQVEGRVSRQAWRIGGQDMTTLQLLAPLRAQLAEAGYDVIFECADADCGGFDFRFETDVLPAPAMYVSLTDFRFVAAQRGTGDHLSLLVSRTGNAGFVQLVRVTEPGLDADLPEITALVRPMTGDGDLAQDLLVRGHAVLTDLEFATGTSELSDGSYATLDALAAFLRANPEARIALVGHTDAVGRLDGNITLSKRRAQAVLERLAGLHGVARDRMVAEGMGYLSPVAPNATPEGREANRRVEVVMLNTE